MDPRSKWNPLQQQAGTLAASLPPLLAEAGRLASSVSLGVHGRRKWGVGDSFWQFRRYTPEDTVSAIDWRQSAKSQHLFVRQREWEAAQSVWFWRDSSATMRFKSNFAKVAKADRAAVLAIALGSLLVRGGERIAVLGQNRPPSSGRLALHAIVQELLQVSEHILPPNVPVIRDSQIVWLSDFLFPSEGMEAVLRRFADAHASGHLVHIIDPAEEDFPFEGRTRFESLAGAETEMFGRAEAVRPAYRERFRAHAEGVVTLARRFGWTYLAHRTDKRAEIALIALYAAVGGELAEGTT